jgi:polysaccharide pyruvyl transferase CsaB
MLICGNYGNGNIGDEAILRALIQKYGKTYKLTVISADPSQTHRAHKIKVVHRFPGGIRSKLHSLLSPRGRKRLKETKRAVDKCDVFLLGGGTLLTDTPLRSILIWSKQVEPAFQAGKEVWVYANGIGPLHTRTAQGIASSILKRAHKVTVRDFRSIEWTKKLGCHKARKVLDPVLHLHWKGKPASLKIDKNTVIFAPRSWAKNTDETSKVFTKFIQYLCLEKGKKVVGIPFENGNSKDVEFLNNIFEQSNVRTRAKIWKNYTDELDVIRAIAQAEAVVGMRLHSLIFSQLTHTPFVGISYMEKVAGLGETLKKTNCIVDLEKLTLEKLIEAYNFSLNSDL